MRGKAMAIVREEIDAGPFIMRASPIAANQTIYHQVTVTRKGKGIEKKSCALCVTSDICSYM